MGAYKNDKTGAEGHDFSWDPIQLGCDQGGGAEDAAGECDAEG